jgi:hypothetical protein
MTGSTRTALPHDKESILASMVCDSVASFSAGNGGNGMASGSTARGRRSKLPFGGCVSRFWQLIPYSDPQRRESNTDITRISTIVLC